MPSPGNPLITRLLAHANAQKAARAASGMGPRGDFITVLELADLLEISPDTIYDAINHGWLEAFRPRGKVNKSSKWACRMVRGVTLRSALVYVIESTDGMDEETMAEVILRLLPQFGSDALLTKFTARIALIRARRGLTDNAAVLEALNVTTEPQPRTLHVLRKPAADEAAQMDLFESVA